MDSRQITTVTFFCFSGFRRRFWAFSQMGLAPRRLAGISGLTFCKLLGSGGANGFGLRPNWSLYGMLQVWENEAAARDFFRENPVFAAYRRQSIAAQTVFLRTTMAHGLWEAKMPFVAEAPFDPDVPVAVLTRATIRSRHLWRFWSRVPAVSRDVEGKPGLIFAVGIGELPLIQQATFSLWQSGRQMMDFAYKRPRHAAVIKQTRDLGWYREELFARFVPYRVEGEGVFRLFDIPDSPLTPPPGSPIPPAVST